MPSYWTVPESLRHYLRNYDVRYSPERLTLMPVLDIPKNSTLVVHGIKFLILDYVPLSQYI